MDVKKANSSQNVDGTEEIGGSAPRVADGGDVVGFTGVGQGPAYQPALTNAPLPPTGFDRVTGGSQLSRLERNPSASGILETHALHAAAAAGAMDRTAFQTELNALMASLEETKSDSGAKSYSFGQGSVDRFFTFLDKHATTPQDKVEAVYALRQNIMMSHRIDIDELRAGLNARGLKLLRNDKLPEGKLGLFLDRNVVRETLDQGSLDKRAAMILMARVKEAADPDDLSWLRAELGKRLDAGTLRFQNPEQGERLRAMLDEKLKGYQGNREIADAVLAAKAEGFAGTAMKRLTHVLSKAGANVPGLFFARRMLEGGLAKAKSNCEGDAKAMAQLSQAEKVVDQTLAPRLEGHLDKDTLRQKLRAGLQQGTFSLKECAVMHSALATSSNATQYAQALMVGMAQLRRLDVATQMLEAQSEMLKKMSESLSDDTRDSSGRIIETAEQRELKRRRERESIERLYVAPAVLMDLAARAVLVSSSRRARADAQSARNPNEQASLFGRAAAFENEESDREAPVKAS